MSAYAVKIRGSEDISVEVRDNPKALNTARAIAIAVAKIRVGDVVEVWRGKSRRLAYEGREVTAVEVRSAT